MISQAYDTPVLIDKGKIVVFQNKKLIISDIFDKDLYFKEVERDFSETVPSSSAIINAKFINSSELQIEYYEGKDFTEKSEIIDLSNDTNYEIYYEKFSVKDKSTHTDIHIEYPQIKNMKSSKVETKVNKLLMEKAISVYEDKDAEGLSLPMETKVEYFDSNIISVKYTGYGFYYGSIHGYNIMYATNINLKTGEIIDIHDLFTVCFQEKLNRNVFKYNGADKASEGETIDDNSFEFGYVNADESIVIEMFKNYYNNIDADKYYFSEKYFNIIAKTPSGPTTYL